MKKQIRIYRLHSRILVSVLIILVGIGIGISCSKDAGVSSTSPGSGPRATKPTLPASTSLDFYPSKNVNYDPFSGMTLGDRKAAIGGQEGVVKYLQVIARHLAHIMNDEKARGILHRIVPKADDGEIHLAQIAMEYPHLLGIMSDGFKNDVVNRAIGGDLLGIIEDTESNGEAFLKVSKALLDLVVTVATPDGQAWDPGQKIPVFYVSPDDNEGALIHGVDASLKDVSFTINGDKIPYPFLYLNFDEDSPMVHVGRKPLSLEMYPEGSWAGLWASLQNTLNFISLTTPADAHTDHSYHGPHYNLLQPVKLIRLHNKHELVGDPEIYLYVVIRIHPTIDRFHEEFFDLRRVDEENVSYYDYGDLRATHGIAYEWNYNYLKEIWVKEDDGLFGHDLIGSWRDPTYLYFYSAGSDIALDTYNVTEGPGDAKVVAVRTTDTYDEEVGR